jgi:hypothetical protein
MEQTWWRADLRWTGTVRNCRTSWQVVTVPTLGQDLAWHSQVPGQRVSAVRARLLRKLYCHRTPPGAWWPASRATVTAAARAPVRTPTNGAAAAKLSPLLVSFRLAWLM